MCIKSQILKEIFKVPCGNALLPSGHNVTSTNTGEAAIIRQPEEHSGLSGAAPGFFAGGGEVNDGCVQRAPLAPAPTGGLGLINIRLRYIASI